MKEEKETTFDKVLEKISNPKPFYLYVILILIFIVPTVKPLGLPIVITDETRVFYDGIENLQPGDKVIYFWEGTEVYYFPPSAQGIPGAAIHKHLFSKPGIKIFVVTVRTPAALPIWDYMIDTFGTYGKEYGVDYVFGGYVAGEESGMASLARDIWGTCGSIDYYGNSFEDLPMMADIHDAEDFITGNSIGIANGVDCLFEIRQWVIPYDLKLYMYPFSGMYAYLRPYYDAGLITGLLAGARGGAEYEVLDGKPYVGIISQDCQSIGHIYLMTIIIAANLAYHLRRLKR